MAKSKKVNLPNKKSMNLYQAPRQESAATIVVLGIIACALVAVCMAAFVVLPKLNEISAKKLANADLQDQLTTYETKVKDYTKVKEEYYRYIGAATDDADLVDRVVIIGIVQDCIKDLGTVPDINVNDNTVSINLTSVSSAKLADVVEKLENNQYVTSVSVSNSSKSGTDVTSSITFEVAEPEVE